MKLPFIIALVFTAAIASLHAADPVVVVHSATRVTVDNVEFGKPIDAIANNAHLAPAIQRALEQWAAAQEVLKTRLDAEQKQNAALKLSDGPRSKLLKELITEAETPERVLKRQAIEAEIAAKTKELETLR